MIIAFAVVGYWGGSLKDIPSKNQRDGRPLSKFQAHKGFLLKSETQTKQTKYQFCLSSFLGFKSFQTIAPGINFTFIFQINIFQIQTAFPVLCH